MMAQDGRGTYNRGTMARSVEKRRTAQYGARLEINLNSGGRRDLLKICKQIKKPMGSSNVRVTRNRGDPLKIVCKLGAIAAVPDGKV
jgi:hypothetical protein